MSHSNHTLYLVRHGEAAARWGDEPDPGLSSRGETQARQTSAALMDELARPVTVISSPLARARETAAPLAEAMGVDVAIDAAFREIPSPVSIEDRSNWLGELMNQTWSMQDVALLAWRARIIDRLMNTDQTTVIFTHFMVLNAAVGALDNRPETVCFRPANASVTRIRRDANGLHLLDLGDELKTVVN